MRVFLGLFALLFLIGGSLYLFSGKIDPSYPSFDGCMRKANSSFDLLYLSSKQVQNQWKLVKHLYEKQLSKKPFSSPKIPKIIHQIWIGGPLPDKYLSLQKSWQDKNPDWEYRLWTDADLPSFPFTNRSRFEKAVNVGEKADILRYEVLNQFGGLYVDTDFECLAPFDPLHQVCDFYVGLEAALTNDCEAAIGNALIGSVPNHPIIQYCLKRIAQKQPGRNGDEVQDISGPGCLKRAFFKCCKKGSYRNIAFPYTFFYPIPSHHRDGLLGKVAKNDWLEPESLGVHYWDTSWGNQPFDDD